MPDAFKHGSPLDTLQGLLREGLGVPPLQCFEQPILRENSSNLLRELLRGKLGHEVALGDLGFVVAAGEVSTHQALHYQVLLGVGLT